MRIEELIVDGSLPAIDAMRRLSETGRRIVFIAPGRVLQAVLTDSDVRKFILRGGNLASPVSQAANHSPKWLPVEERARAREVLNRYSIEALPLLDKAGCIADIVFVQDLGGVHIQKNLDMPVVIMAGGLGARLYPYTRILPKPLIPVGEVPIVERVMNKFAAFGCTCFTLVVNYRKNMIKSYFADCEADYRIEYAEEDNPLGTGGGLCLLKDKVNEPFFLTNCDILIDADYADIAAFHQKQQNDITVVCATKQYVIPYGVVDLDEAGNFGALSEKPHMNFLTNTGMYVVQPGVVQAIEDGVSQGFTDIIAQCRARGGRVGVYPVSEDSWMDMGQMEALDEMRRKLEQG